MARFKSISPATLMRLLRGEEELALIDVREELAFGERHILYASCMPLSRLEPLAPMLVPRRSVALVLCDAGEELAGRAAERLAALGWSNVALLAGGVDAWEAAGHELFSGVNVPSKAFGELVEHRCGTPSVSADELKAMLDRGDDVVVLDSRPMAEYRARSIPSGLCVPGAELAYRVHDLVPSAGTTVVVNCAGRTRSIIGAQSLINAGIPNRVVALRNGTMGWHLAGHALETGQARSYDEPSAAGLAAASEAARRVAERFGVRRIDHQTLAQWRAESEQRTLYLLDVRSPQEYEAGHLPGSRSAPGGQLVQETDMFVATLRSRVVLVDDTGVRATMTASWLNQMGWPEVVVLDDALADRTLVRGAGEHPVAGLGEAAAETVEAHTLAAWLDAGEAEVLDLASSREYREGHLPGAAWGVRARLGRAIAGLEGAGTLVLTSGDGVLARLAAVEAAMLSDRPTRVLDGGTAAWRALALALESGETRMLDVADDIWLRPYEKDWGVEQAMQAYLDWEVALIPRIERDGTARFRLPRG